jgi:hypothetical protein
MIAAPQHSHNAMRTQCCGWVAVAQTQRVGPWIPSLTRCCSRLRGTRHLPAPPPACRRQLSPALACATEACRSVKILSPVATARRRLPAPRHAAAAAAGHWPATGLQRNAATGATHGGAGDGVTAARQLLPVDWKRAAVGRRRGTGGPRPDHVELSRDARRVDIVVPRAGWDRGMTSSHKWSMRHASRRGRVCGWHRCVARTPPDTAHIPQGPILVDRILGCVCAVRHRTFSPDCRICNRVTC